MVRAASRHAGDDPRPVSGRAEDRRRYPGRRFPFHLLRTPMPTRWLTPCAASLRGESVRIRIASRVCCAACVSRRARTPLLPRWSACLSQREGAGAGPHGRRLHQSADRQRPGIGVRPSDPPSATCSASSWPHRPHPGRRVRLGVGIKRAEGPARAATGQRGGPAPPTQQQQPWSPWWLCAAGWLRRRSDPLALAWQCSATTCATTAVTRRRWGCRNPVRAVQPLSAAPARR